MKYSIILKRANDITRSIEFDNTKNIDEQFKNIYKTLWYILFNETSDKLFAKSFWSSPFYSFKLFRQFKKATHDKQMISNYKNFNYVYKLIKILLINYNYWNPKDIQVIYIIDSNDILTDPSDIVLKN